MVIEIIECQNCLPDDSVGVCALYVLHVSSS
jgi:hypothetical protein